MNNKSARTFFIANSPMKRNDEPFLASGSLANKPDDEDDDDDDDAVYIPYVQINQLLATLCSGGERSRKKQELNQPGGGYAFSAPWSSIWIENAMGNRNLK